MAEEALTPKSQLRRAMGFWDVLLFNIAAVLGPRWIAAAAHNGTSSISLWVLAAVFFFLPTALIIIELSTRYPAEGGLYVWSKEAFGDFHGFVAGWAYWIYTFLFISAGQSMRGWLGVQGTCSGRHWGCWRLQCCSISLAWTSANGCRMPAVFPPTLRW